MPSRSVIAPVFVPANSHPTSASNAGATPARIFASRSAAGALTSGRTSRLAGARDEEVDSTAVMTRGVTCRSSAENHGQSEGDGDGGARGEGEPGGGDGAGGLLLAEHARERREEQRHERRAEDEGDDALHAETERAARDEADDDRRADG